MIHGAKPESTIAKAKESFELPSSEQTLSKVLKCLFFMEAPLVDIIGKQEAVGATK